MGDEYDRMEALADEYKAGLINADGSPVDDFDSPDEFDTPAAEEVKPKHDPARPEAKRGRYTLPNPESGKSKSWQRVTNFVKLTDDTYHLELWKQRNVAKGVALLAGERDGFLDDLVRLDVKKDKERLNRICEKAQDQADAYKMSDEGTALHTSTELADYAGGILGPVPQHHRAKVRLYLDALAANGLSVVPGMIERVTASATYEVAGKFDRVYQLADGSYVIGDLKTGDSLDLSLPSIAAQLDCYRDGINNVGIFNGQRYDTDIKVRDDFGIVVHLPSTRNEVTVLMIDLDQGREINRVNLQVRAARRIKAKHVARTYQADLYGAAKGDTDQHWLEALNAAHAVTELISVADRARAFGQWNERLANQARLLAAELTGAAAPSMGS